MSCPTCLHGRVACTCRGIPPAALECATRVTPDAVGRGERGAREGLVQESAARKEGHGRTSAPYCDKCSEPWPCFAVRSHYALVAWKEAAALPPDAGGEDGEPSDQSRADHALAAAVSTEVCTHLNEVWGIHADPVFIRKCVLRALRARRSATERKGGGG